MVSFVGNWKLLVADYIKLFSKEVLDKKRLIRVTKKCFKRGRAYSRYPLPIIRKALRIDTLINYALPPPYESETHCI